MLPPHLMWRDRVARSETTASVRWRPRAASCSIPELAAQLVDLCGTHLSGRHRLAAIDFPSTERADGVADLAASASGFPPMPQGWQGSAASLRLVAIGVILALVLVLRPRGLLGDDATVSRYVSP